MRQQTILIWLFGALAGFCLGVLFVFYWFVILTGAIILVMFLVIASWISPKFRVFLFGFLKKKIKIGEVLKVPGVKGKKGRPKGSKNKPKEKSNIETE